MKFEAADSNIRKPSQSNTEMPTCDVCEKSFPDNAQLNRHMNGKRPCKPPSQKSLTCTECGRTCTTPSNLKKHQRNMHPTMKDLESDDSRQASSGISIQGKEIHNFNNTNITVNVNITAPKNFVCPDIEFLETMPAQKLKDIIGDPASPTAIAKLFSEIYLDERKPANHSVLLESLTSETGYCFNEKWRREATEALITQCASNTALKLADFEHIYQNVLTKQNAKAVADVCDTIEKEDFTGELYQMLRDKITETLVEFTARKAMLLQVAKDEAKSGVSHPKSKTIEGWRLGGELREAAIKALRA